MPTQEFIITGTVQGVFYRSSARQKAEALGITGWVKNLPDGSVLIRATGNQEALTGLKAWCTVGPPGAVVQKISVNVLADESFVGFRIIR